MLFQAAVNQVVPQHYSPMPQSAPPPTVQLTPPPVVQSVPFVAPESAVASFGQSSFSGVSVDETDGARYVCLLAWTRVRAHTVV